MDVVYGWRDDLINGVLGLCSVFSNKVGHYYDPIAGIVMPSAELAWAHTHSGVWHVNVQSECERLFVPPTTNATNWEIRRAFNETEAWMVTSNIFPVTVITDRDASW